jgi:hypothetical protein
LPFKFNLQRYITVEILIEKVKKFVVTDGVGPLIHAESS